MTLTLAMKAKANRTSALQKHACRQLLRERSEAVRGDEGDQRSLGGGSAERGQA